MEYRWLGRTGLRVSRLCFGSLTVSPLQADLPVREAARVMRHAFENGVNFVDTAELYQNYAHIRAALSGYDDRVVLATKCYAYRRDQAEKSLHYALRSLKRDYIDIFMLHELEYLLGAKEKGLIRAVGISTHFVAGVEAGASDPAIEVIHPIVNRRGIGIRDGTAEAMIAAIRRAAENGKGVYGMKALGGGHLLDEPAAALRFVLAVPGLASVAVGMQSTQEVDYNLCLVSGRPVPAELERHLRRRPRRLLIQDWCRACGECVKLCSAGALYNGEDGRTAVRQEICTLCGYCAAVCPEFAIKVI